MLSGFQKVWTEEGRCFERKENGDSLSVFRAFTAMEIGCLLGNPCVIFMYSNNGREELVASVVGSLGPGEVLQTVPNAFW